MATDNRITFRAGPELSAWLQGRAARTYGSHSEQGEKGLSLQAKDELELWKLIQELELKRNPFTLPEACCIADVFNGHLSTPGLNVGIGVVYFACYDAFTMARSTPLPDKSSYGTKWEIDEESLLARLQGLGPTADLALVDAIARWWAEERPATAEGFAAVGLRILNPPGSSATPR